MRHGDCCEERKKPLDRIQYADASCFIKGIFYDRATLINSIQEDELTDSDDGN